MGHTNGPTQSGVSQRGINVRTALIARFEAFGDNYGAKFRGPVSKLALNKTGVVEFSPLLEAHVTRVSVIIPSASVTSNKLLQDSLAISSRRRCSLRPPSQVLKPRLIAAHTNSRANTIHLLPFARLYPLPRDLTIPHLNMFTTVPCS